MPIDLARLILSIIAILGLLLLSMWIMSPFFTAMIWALMVVVACWPIMLKLQGWMRGHRGLAVTAMTLLMLLIFIVPFALAVSTIVQNADTVVGWARDIARFQLPPPPGWVAQLPLVGTSIVDAWNGLRDAGLDSLVQRFAPYAGKGAQLVAAQAGNLGLLLVHFLLTVIIAAVMFSQGEAGAYRLLVLAERVGGERGVEAVRLAGAAIRAVALGVVVTALLQTIAAGVGLYLAGVPFAGLLTAAILILCIAQVGAAVVMIPAVVWLFWSGDTGWGIFLLVWSVFVLTMDNFIRPLLIRRGADLPLLLIFAGVIGGLLSMGLVGLFVGPVVLAVTWRLFEAWSGLRTPPQAAAVQAPPPEAERVQVAVAPPTPATTSAVANRTAAGREAEQFGVPPIT